MFLVFKNDSHKRHQDMKGCFEIEHPRILIEGITANPTQRLIKLFPNKLGEPTGAHEATLHKMELNKVVAV